MSDLILKHVVHSVIPADRQSRRIQQMVSRKKNRPSPEEKNLNGAQTEDICVIFLCVYCVLCM